MHRLHHIDLIFLLNEKVEYKRGVAQPEHVANLSENGRKAMSI